jgi:hypothetical protein
VDICLEGNRPAKHIADAVAEFSALLLVVVRQQSIAGTFFDLGLVPKKLTIADVVRKGKV